jgi:hypothetical protein
MAFLFTRSTIVGLWLITFGLAASYVSQSGLEPRAIAVIGLLTVFGLVATALAFSMGAKLWSTGRRGTASELSDAIDLERFDSDKG